MANDYDFNKQFKNMGIDKDSIMGANGESKKEEPKKEEPEESKEIMLLKRKLDYLQNNIVKKLEERIEELDKKIEGVKAEKVNENRDFTSLKNDVKEVKEKMNNIRISFSEDNKQEQNQQPAQSQQSQQTQDKGEEKKEDPSKFSVENYFNYSNTM